MRLGETIYRLRTQKNMSQGDLADALEVSRQSISKWENNSAVPELEKLVRMSQLFGVSLDELVLDKKAEPVQQTVQTVYVEKPRRSGAKTAGIILLCFAALVWLLITVLGDILVGAVLALPFLVCGLICLFVPGNPGLWCFWTIYALVDIYFRFATGVNWRFILNPRFYTGEWTVHLIVAWCMLLPMVILTAVTVVKFAKKPLNPNRRNLAVLIAGAVILAVLHLPVSWGGIELGYRVLAALVDWVRNLLFIFLLIHGIRLWKGRKKA